MKKIHKESSIIELDELYEESKGVTIPYYVQREEQNKEIVWFGLETNWKTIKGKWHILNKGKWEEGSMPEYEKIYIDLKNNNPKSGYPILRHP